METKIIKQIIRVGNSSGVLLPRRWYGGEVRIELVERPTNIKKDILEILDTFLSDISGIYLVGSYARNEQTKNSDIDILVITSDINKNIKKGKYEITLMSKKNIERQLKENLLPILPWLIEAKPILNKELIENYKKTQLTKKNLKWHIDTTKSAMRVVKEDIKLSEQFSEIKMMNASAYSLILRLRTLYIIDCLKKKKLWKKKEFLDLVESISGSLNVYKIYIDIKNKNKSENNLSIKEAKKLVDYITKEIIEVEKWVKEKKD